MKTAKDDYSSNLTPYQATRLVRSIAYRRRLCSQLEELEAQLMAYAQTHGIHYLAGYEISVNDGRLYLREMEPLEWKQLKLHLEAD